MNRFLGSILLVAPLAIALLPHPALAGEWPVRPRPMAREVIVEPENEQVIVVKEQPPVERIEVIGAPPEQGRVWIPGHWARREGEWTWIAGHWGRPPHPAGIWEPGHWAWRPFGWTWRPGHWVW